MPESEIPGMHVLLYSIFNNSNNLTAEHFHEAKNLGVTYFASLNKIHYANRKRTSDMLNVEYSTVNKGARSFRDAQTQKDTAILNEIKRMKRILSATRMLHIHSL